MFEPLAYISNIKNVIKQLYDIFVLYHYSIEFIARFSWYKNQSVCTHKHLLIIMCTSKQQVRKERKFSMKIRRIMKKKYYSLKIRVEYYKEAKFFIKNYMLSSNQKENVEYNILMISHSIEKGLCNINNPRPFGIKKIAELQYFLDFYLQNYQPSYASNLGLSMIYKYLKFYEYNNFIKNKEYLNAKAYLENINYNLVDCGSLKYKPVIKSKTFYEFLKSRHSVRSFKKEHIDNSIVEYAVKCALQAPSACNRQMIKAHIYYNFSNKISIINEISQGLSGFDIGNINYILITYDETAFIFPGERNQGMFNAGLFSMNLVNAFHEKGIGSCFIQFGNDFKEESVIKKKLEFKEAERIAVILAFGYYSEEYNIPSSIRKGLEDVMIVEK